jgi:hypothetical protein
MSEKSSYNMKSLNKNQKKWLVMEQVAMAISSIKTTIQGDRLLSHSLLFSL